MTFRIVRKEPSEAMVTAYFDAHGKAATVFADVPDTWAAMLAASESPTDAEIDALCKAMWGDKWWWNTGEDEAPGHRQSAIQRHGDRTRMRKFLERFL